MRDKMAKMIVFLVAVLIRGTHTKEDAIGIRMEFALVLGESGSINHTDYQRMVAVVRKLPDRIELSEDGIRAALVVFGSDSRVEVNLTGSAEPFRKLQLTNKLEYNTSTEKGLRNVKDKVFVNARPEVQKVVFLITDGAANDKPLAEAEADELRARGCLIYVAFIGTIVFNDTATKAHVERLAGDPSHVFPVEKFEDFTDGVIQNVQEKIKEDIRCAYKEDCRFDDQSQQSCVPFLWQNVSEGDRPCNNTKPSPSKTCGTEDCEKSCDNWPWTQRECKEEDAGKTVTIDRDQEWKNQIKPKQLATLYDHCAKQKSLVCAAATTGPGPGPIQSVNPEQRNQSPAPSSKSGMAPWVIGLIVALGVLAIIVVIVVVAVVTTKRKKAKLAMQKKLAESTAKSVKSAKSARSASEAGKGAKAGAASNTVPSSLFTSESGRGKSGKDENLQVSLRDTRISEKPRPKAKDGGVTKSAIARSTPQTKQSSGSTRKMAPSVSSKSKLPRGPMATSKKGTISSLSKSAAAAR